MSVKPKRELVTNSIVPRIKAVLTAAEQTAALVAEEAESEASRRSSELLAVADADAERIRREATRRVEEYLAASRRRIDAFATARIERITELTEGVIEAAASIQERFEQAASVQREVHAMVAALGTVAEAVAREVAQASPILPSTPAGPNRGEDGPSWAQTGPDGTVVGETLRNGHARARGRGEDAAGSGSADGEREREDLEVDLGAAEGVHSDPREEGDLDVLRHDGGVASEVEVEAPGESDRDDDGELAPA
jgi:hypothetical protein